MARILSFSMLFANVTEKWTSECAHTCTHTIGAYADTHATQMCTPTESTDTHLHTGAETRKRNPAPPPKDPSAQAHCVGCAHSGGGSCLCSLFLDCSGLCAPSAACSEPRVPSTLRATGGRQAPRVRAQYRAQPAEGPARAWGLAWPGEGKCGLEK